MPNSVAFINMLNARTKSELVKICRDAVVDRTDFANIVMAAKMGVIPYDHYSIHREIVSSQVSPTDSDFQAFSESLSRGSISGKAIKFTRKMSEQMRQRRLLNCHLFVHGDFWNLFYFDQKDTDSVYPHWAQGSHIHLMNWLTHPRKSLTSIIEETESDKPKLKGSIHIRYKDTRRSKPK